MEKLQKEQAAGEKLTEQKLIMEKVVEESRKLQLEADENSKLREFLVDRGHVVDTLQGEISVICQDVRLLKEKVDARVPLSKSLLSSQTTCRLASSNSSVKTAVSVYSLEEFQSLFILSVIAESSIYTTHAAERVRDHHRQASSSSNKHGEKRSYNTAIHAVDDEFNCKGSSISDIQHL